MKHLGVRIQRHWCCVADPINRAELVGDGAAGVRELRIEECRFGEGGREEACSAASATRGWHDALWCGRLNELIDLQAGGRF